MARCALTFDDGPHPVWTPAVLDALGDLDVRATFFVIAPRATAHPDVVRRALDEGHEVELHCTEHVRHTELGREGVERDADDALAALATLGVHPRRWRPPYGVCDTFTWEVAADRGLELTGWTADSEDWAGHPVEVLLERTVPRLRAAAVVLCHDAIGPGRRRPECAATVQLVRRLIPLARERGLEPVALGALGNGPPPPGRTAQA